MYCVKPINLRGRLVPCGRCYACLANRQRSWTFRLEYERQNCSFFLWLTLTYDDDHIPVVDGRLAVSKEDCREFFERLRKHYKCHKSRMKFKHFLVSEYGPTATERPHYHLVLFCYVNTTDTRLLRKYKIDLEEYLDTAWGKGFVNNKRFHNRVFGYVTKYCCKPELIGQDVPVPVFSLISQGIGESYLSKIDSSSMVETDDFVVQKDGRRMQLPRYYKNKLLGFLSYTPKQAQDLSPEDFSKWLDFRIERDKKLRDKECEFYTDARNYERVHGAGSFSRKQLAIIEYKQNEFINKLKKRQNV